MKQPTTRKQHSSLCPIRHMSMLKYGCPNCDKIDEVANAILATIDSLVPVVIGDATKGDDTERPVLYADEVRHAVRESVK